MTETLPPRACVIVVEEDFIELPIGMKELWIDNIYVMTRTENNAGSSSTLMLHKDGNLWITNSVFQGRGDPSRAIDVNTLDKGSPLVYFESAHHVAHAAAEARAQDPECNRSPHSGIHALMLTRR
jgi:hypothetical protein